MTYFVKTDDFSQETAKFLPRAFEKRQASDYADYCSISLAEAEHLRHQASHFMEECERHLAILFQSELPGSENHDGGSI